MCFRPPRVRLSDLPLGEKEVETLGRAHYPCLPSRGSVRRQPRRRDRKDASDLSIRRPVSHCRRGAPVPPLSSGCSREMAAPPLAGSPWTRLLPILLLLACLAVSSASPAAGHKKSDDSTLTLWTPIGTLRGARGKSYRGRPFVSFRGVPYAQPPLDHLRFAPPEPVDRWDGELDATHDAPICIQKNYLVAGYPVQGQEDCLYLNIYVPLIRQKPKRRTIFQRNGSTTFLHVDTGAPNSPAGAGRRWWEERQGPYQGRQESLLPVMVYVHGGGWFSGTGASVVQGPEYLVDRDVVLVTFNYRLGAMGFLSTEDAAATGNWGLKDQVTALKWVQKNIRYFGGNAEKVTLFGQSAGAASVHYHMLSPMSKGLFHRAITQSGSALSAWAWPRPNARSLARRQGLLVGCDDLDTSDLIDCLRQVSAFNITETGAELKLWSVDPLTQFAPVVESECWPDEAFLTDHPLTLAAAGDADRRLPWMAGVVPEEGVVRAAAILNDPALVSDLNARLDTLGPFLFELERSVVDASPGTDELWSKIAACYLTSTGGPHVGEDTAQGFLDGYTDRGFLHATHKAVQLYLNNSMGPVFLYEFTYRGSLSWSRVFAGNDKDYGVSHCDDLLYLFRAPAFFPDFQPASRDLDTVDLMVTLWTNFAKAGNPTPRAVRGTTWPPATLRNPHLHMDIGDELEVKESLHENRLAFWDSLPLLENTVSSEGTHEVSLQDGLWPGALADNCGGEDDVGSFL